MVNWYEYWNSKPTSFADDDVLRQVGWTINGQPISDDNVDAMVSDIDAALRLNADDALLDLCCGNGLITSRSALRCREVTGVDFSAPLIRIARDRFSGPGIDYVLADIRSLPAFVYERPYSKIMMYGAIQHLSAADVEGLLQHLQQSNARMAPVFFGAIPDRDRIYSFYDTEDRREEYFRRVTDGTEAIGQWWATADLYAIGARCGYRVEIRAQRPILHTARYRFDSLLTPNDATI